MNSDETTEQIEPTLKDVLDAINSFKKEVEEKFNSIDIQLEAIRQGTVMNSVAFDRLKADVLMIGANVKELTEDVRRSGGNLSLK